MTKGPSFRFGLLGTVVVTALMVGWHYGDILPHLNQYYLGSGGDGIKNYYTLLYHVQYDSTYSHFEGMNYPFGEQVVFTDNQPLLSNTMRWVSRNITDVSGYGVGAINLAMLLSIVFCALFLYLFGVRLKLPPWYAALLAIGLALFSPQVHRMGGHYALSYGFVIPLILWLAHRFWEKPLPRRSLALGLTVFFLAGLHFYYFAIGAFFLSLFLGLRWLGEPNWKNLLKTAGHFALQILLPFVLLNLWFWLTDPVSDRPSSPYGFLFFRATWKTSFLPLFFPHGDWLKPFFNLNWINWEGIAYVGLVASLMTVFLGGLGIRFLIKRQWNRVLAPTGDPFLDRIVLAGGLLLLFSFGIPFVWGLEHLIDSTGPLKQFRGIGRFSWIFFYVGNLGAFYWLYHRLRALESRKKGMIWLLTLPLLILFVEGTLFSNKTKYSTNRIEALESKGIPADHWMQSVAHSDFQAILPLPYYHVGSENFWMDPQAEILPKTLIASLQSGLPLMSVHMSRTSLEQTFTNLQLILDPVEPLALLDTLPDDRPLLLWIDKAAINDYPRQQALLELAQPLWDSEDVSLFALPIAALGERRKQRLEQQKRVAMESRPINLEGWTSTGQNDAFIYISFDENKSEKTFLGSGAYVGSTNVYNTVYSATLPPGFPGDYVFSCWVYIKKDGYPAQNFGFEQLDATGEYLDYKTAKLGDYLVATSGDWGLIEFPFTLKQADAKLNFFFRKEAYSKFPLWMDELMIRRSGTDVFREDGEVQWWNNRPYPKP